MCAMVAMGFTKRIPAQLARGPVESGNPEIHEFYDRLLDCIRHPAPQGQWLSLECAAAWDGNWTWEGFIGFAWRTPGQTPLITVVNYAFNAGQCYLRVPFEDFRDRAIRLRDLMGPHEYDRHGTDILLQGGLYLELSPWGYHIFELLDGSPQSRCE